jgi:hypothetical protein
MSGLEQASMERESIGAGVSGTVVGLSNDIGRVYATATMLAPFSRAEATVVVGQ